MIEIDIPGFARFHFAHLVLDVNGTIARDGQLLDGVAELLAQLQPKLAIHLITADTHGNQEIIDRQLSLKATRIPTQDQAEAKLNYIEGLGSDQVVAIGNGANDAAMLENLHFTKQLGLCIKQALERGDARRFGELMHEHWEHKKIRSGNMSNSKIDTWYEVGRANRAIGGKLVGAGGGGFLMFYTEDPKRLRQAMAHEGLDEVRFRYDFEGTKVLFA